MYSDSYETQLLAKQYRKDKLREAEQARLIRTAKGPREVRGWWLQMPLILSSLLALFTRPQS